VYCAEFDKWRRFVSQWVCWVLDNLQPSEASRVHQWRTCVKSNFIPCTCMICNQETLSNKWWLLTGFCILSSPRIPIDSNLQSLADVYTKWNASTSVLTTNSFESAIQVCAYYNPLLSWSMMETDAFQFCSNIVSWWCCVILTVTAITQAIGLVLIDTAETFFNKLGHSSTIKTRIEASGFVWFIAPLYC